MPSKLNEKTLEARLIRNGLEQCFTDGCIKPRHGLSRYCSMCKYKRYFHGWSGGRKIKPSEYATEKRMVAALIDKNRDGRSIGYALGFLDNWLKNGLDLVQGLHDAGVTAEDVLVESGAMYLYMRKNPRLIPGWTALAHAIGLNVIRLHKAHRRIYGRDNFAIGNHIVGNLRILFEKMWEGSVKMEMKRKRVKEALSEDLVV